MKPLHKPQVELMRLQKQRGVVLFFALIALLAMSLAAVALIRSVDTNTIIAGNIAYKRSATSSGDLGVESAITALTAIDQNNSALNVLTDPTHPLNLDSPTTGYYSSAGPVANLINGTFTWTNANSQWVTSSDGSGNAVRFIVERMCTTANLPIASNSCLFSSGLIDTNGMQVLLPQNVCHGSGCPAQGASPEYRITVQTTGAKYTVSYVQVFVY